MKKLYIPVVLGTARAGNHSQKVAAFVHGEISKDERFETALFSVSELDISATTPGDSDDKGVASWREIVDKADAFVVVTPEYNHSFPGELKLLLDSTREGYARKPVLTCGVSSGPFGGSRAVENLLSVYVDLRLLPIRDALYFGNVGGLFDDSGNITDEKYFDRVGAALDELAWHAKVLKEGRDDD